MQKNKNNKRELIRRAEKLIKKLKREEAKITPNPSDEELLAALFKSKNVTQKDR